MYVCVCGHFVSWEMQEINASMPPIVRISAVSDFGEILWVHMCAYECVCAFVIGLCIRKGESSACMPLDAFGV